MVRKHGRQRQFGSQQIVDECGWCSSVFAADLDGDGDMDLASASLKDNKIAWYKLSRVRNTRGHTKAILSM